MFSRVFLKILPLVLFTAACTSAPNFASAQGLCGDGVATRVTLVEKYSEVERGWGMTLSNHLFQIYEREDADRSWTALKTSPKNAAITCIMAVGKNSTLFPKDNAIQTDDEGRVLVWRGESRNVETGVLLVFDIFVNEIDDTWIVRQLNSSGGIRIMITGTGWTEVSTQITGEGA